MDKLDPLIEGYLSYLLTVGRKTRRTVTDVRCTLRRAVAAFTQTGPDVPLWRLSLTDFLHWIERERLQGRTPACLAKYLCHLRGLLEYAWRSGRTDRNVLDGFQLQDNYRSKEPLSLSLEEAQRLINSCPRSSALERRDRLVVLLLYGCGLRTSELCALSIADIQRERQELTIARAKGDRPRVIPIPEGVFVELLAYLLDRGSRGALFVTQHLRRRITAKDVCAIVSVTARRAELSAAVTARTLRHSFATHLMDRGVDLAIIASLMGHRSPKETGVYLHVLPGRREVAVSKLTLGGGRR